MNARGELPEVDEHALDDLLAECAQTLRRGLAIGGVCLVLALAAGSMYLQVMAVVAQ